MSGKGKLGKGLRFGILMVIVALVMWLLPMGSLFANDSVGQIEVTKTFSVSKNKEFDFEITGPDSYSDTFNLKDGQTWIKSNLPVGKYKITEKDTGYLVTITVGGTTVVTNQPTPQFVEVELTEDGKVVVFEDGCGDGTGLVHNKDVGIYYKEKENCGEVPDEYKPGPGQVTWHLTMSPVVAGTEAWIDFINVNGVKDDGEEGFRPGGEQGALHWYIITDKLYAPDWIANVTSGMVYKDDCSIKTDLRVSHTCYGGEIEEGSIKVTKTFTDAKTEFNFKVTGPNSYSKSFKLKDGEFWTSGDIPVGTYKVEETDTGYLATITVGGTPVVTNQPTPQSVEVEVQKDTEVVVDVTNEIMEGDKGKIQITKTFVGEGIDPPDFFNFIITGPNPYSYSFKIAPGGTWISGDLPLGTYNIKEEDSGYLVTIKVDDKTIATNQLTPYDFDVKLEKDGQVVKVEIENDPIVAEIELTKIGLTGNAKAYFKLSDGTNYYNTDGTIKSAPGYKGEPVSVASPVVTWKNLSVGKYTIVESIVPSGFIAGTITPNPVEIKAGDQGTTIKVTATNTKTNGGDGDGDGDGDADIEVLAFTGFDMINYIIGLVLILIGGIGSVYLTRMLRRKEE